jgi:capsular polysaccharide biosynthesis protein
MTFREQFELFSRNGIVIGQHGAGLANAMWLTPHESSLIELSHERNPDHFLNYCGDFEIDYTRLYFQAGKTADQSSVLRIDDKQVLDVVDRKLEFLAKG